MENTAALSTARPLAPAVADANPPAEPRLSGKGVAAGPAPSKPRPSKGEKPVWHRLTEPYRQANNKRAAWMVVNTFGGFLACWAAMHWLLKVAWWAPLFLVPITAGFLVRVFIIQHDCGHGSFTSSQKVNDILGTICGIVMVTPYYGWRQSHATHHAQSGNLEGRGIGDIPLMTKAEYLDKPPLQRFAYRLLRNPFTLFVVGPLFVFFVAQRIPFLFVFRRLSKKAWWNVHLTTVAFFGAMAGLMAWLGPDIWVILLSAWLAMSAGVWLFYVQHTYEDVYFTHQESWDYTTAGIAGSSYYRLPKVLQFFTGYIGYHHVHHLTPKVPSYHLAACHEANPWFHQATTLGLKESLKTAGLKLFDEERGKMIDFQTAHADERAARSVAAA